MASNVAFSQYRLLAKGPGEKKQPGNATPKRAIRSFAELGVDNLQPNSHSIASQASFKAREGLDCLIASLLLQITKNPSCGNRPFVP